MKHISKKTFVLFHSTCIRELSFLFDNDRSRAMRDFSSSHDLLFENTNKNIAKIFN